MAFLKQEKLAFETLFGTPDGATKLAVLAQYKWAKAQNDFEVGKYALSMGRKTPKDHGEVKDRFFVGEPRGKTIVLEDVTTTGGLLLKAVKTLLDQGVEVTAAVALTNRNETMEDGRHVSEALQDLGVKYFAMSNGVELLPELIKNFTTSIEREFKQYGQQALKL